MSTTIVKDSIRLLEASSQYLHLAVVSLGMPKCIDFYEPTATYAVEIGLIGTSAELAMSACLIQALGASAIEKTAGRFKTLAEICHDFQALVRNEDSITDFLFSGIDDKVTHRNKLIDASKPFRLLAVSRAAGVHAGKGLLLHTTIIQASQVADFLDALALSDKLAPYLKHISRCIVFSAPHTLIIENLVRRFQEGSAREKTELLSSLFLVLPDIPESEPDWLSAFERLTVCPQEKDLTYLLNVLETAIPGSLIRASKAGGGVSVIVKPDDPYAIPIAPYFLRREFNETKEQWFASIGTANGNLKNSIIALPPPESVKRVFSIGLVKSGVLNQDQLFGAHEVWPFIASSLNVQGTYGPYWFLIRKCGDLGQLESQLNRVKEIAKKALCRGLEECIHGIQQIRVNNKINETDNVFSDVIKSIDNVSKARQKILNCYDKNISEGRALPNISRSEIEKIVQENLPVGTLLEKIFGLNNFTGRAYWIFSICEASLHQDDLPSLVKVLEDRNLSSTHTQARKAIRRIDFMFYGLS